MTKEQMVAAFNEWMRRYTEDPASFAAEFQSVGEFLAQQAAGAEPSYGQTCAEMMESFHRDLSVAV